MSSPRIYELENPSDAVCFETDDEEALVAGVVLLGSGWYGLTRDDGKTSLPVRPFGIEAEELAEKTVAFLDVRENRSRAAAALRTALYCSMADRKALGAAFADLPETQRRAAIAKFNDAKRSSLNNIGASAHRLADQLERSASEGK